MSTGIGQQLREARYAKGVTLSDAASETGVRETHLLALERDELEAIGIDAVYVRGILRKYADYLGLNSTALLAHHRETAGPAPAVMPATDAAPGAGGSRRRVGAIVGAILMIAIVSAATFAVLNLRRVPDDQVVVASSGGQKAATTVTASEATPSEASEEPSEESVEIDIPQGETPEDLTMKLEFTDKVWIRVLVDGKNKLEGIMRPGAVTQFTGNDTIDLRIGVADAVEFSLNGAWYGNIASDFDGPVNVSCTPETSCKVAEEG
ncbi:hypothetical protein BH23ACT10_BH23ACT10_10310 [soil metagenome]